MVSLEELNLDADSSQVLNLQLHGMEQLDDRAGYQLTTVGGLCEHHSPGSRRTDKNESTETQCHR